MKEASVKKTARKVVNNLPGPGPGRPKGVPNKVTTQLKEAILEAATEAGGERGLVGYLTQLATSNSAAFAGLLGKVLPTTLEGSLSIFDRMTSDEQRVIFDAIEVIERDAISSAGGASGTLN